MKTYHRYKKIRIETPTMLFVEFILDFGTYIPKSNIISVNRNEKIIVINKEFHDKTLSSKIKPFKIEK
jgi:hypothetical protein